MTWLNSNKLRIESILAALVLLSVVINLLTHVMDGAPLAFTLATLALFYLLTAFLPGSSTARWAALAEKGTALASCASVVGLLMVWLQLPGAAQFLWLGIVSLVVFGGWVLYLWATSQLPKSFPTLIRVALLGGLVASVLSELMALSSTTF